MRAGMLRHPPRRVKPQLDEGGSCFARQKRGFTEKEWKKKQEGRRIPRLMQGAVTWRRAGRGAAGPCGRPNDYKGREDLGPGSAAARGQRRRTCRHGLNSMPPVGKGGLMRSSFGFACPSDFKLCFPSNRETRFPGQSIPKRRGEFLKAGPACPYPCEGKVIINLPPVPEDVRKRIDVQTGCMFLHGSRSRTAVPGFFPEFELRPDVLQLVF